MVRGRGIAVTAVALMYQCALITRIARGRGTACPNPATPLCSGSPRARSSGCRARRTPPASLPRAEPGPASSRLLEPGASHPHPVVRHGPAAVAGVRAVGAEPALEARRQHEVLAAELVDGLVAEA